MRIHCPFCGERDSDEFASTGLVRASRPAADAPIQAFVDHVHFPDNPAGEVREYWHHVHGCRQWLIAVRDTRTHLIVSVELARRGAE